MDRTALRILLALIRPDIDTEDLDQIWYDVDTDSIWGVRTDGEEGEKLGSYEDALKTLREISLRNQQIKQINENWNYPSPQTMTERIDFKDLEERISKDLIRESWENEKSDMGNIEWLCPGENCGEHINITHIDSKHHYCSYCETEWDLEDLIHVK